MRANLTGKVALVCGSTAGIGRAIAGKFARCGADVVINGRNPEVGLEVVREIEKAGGKALFVKADITSYEKVRGMVDAVLREREKIDIVVSNGGAGHPPPMFFHETDPDLYPDYMKTYLFTRLYVIKAVLDHMKERKGGKIIITASDAGRIPTPSESLIGAANAGLVMITKVLAREFSRWKIQVNAIGITVTAGTPGYERTINLEGSVGKLFRKAVERTPFWPITADDIVEVALFLASQGSARITGQTISVSGGLSFPG